MQTAVSRTAGEQIDRYRHVRFGVWGERESDRNPEKCQLKKGPGNGGGVFCVNSTIYHFINQLLVLVAD